MHGSSLMYSYAIVAPKNTTVSQAKNAMPSPAIFQSIGLYVWPRGSSFNDSTLISVMFSSASPKAKGGNSAKM